MSIVNWIIENWIQVVGVLTGAGSVYYLAKNWGKAGWTFGIINAAFFVVLFVPQHLYGDVILNSYYLVTSALGLYWWLRGGKESTPLKITRLDLRGWLYTSGAVVASAVAVGWFFNTYTNASYAYVDMFILALSLVAQYLLAKKIFENWWLWILSDIVAAPLYFAKGLPLVAGLSVVMLLLCIYGIFVWRKDEKEEQCVTSAA